MISFETYLQWAMPVASLPLAAAAVAIGARSAISPQPFILHARWLLSCLAILFAPWLWEPFVYQESAFYSSVPYALVAGCILLGALAAIARFRCYLAYNVSDVSFRRAIDGGGRGDSPMRLEYYWFAGVVQLRSRRGTEALFEQTVALARDKLRSATRPSALTPAFHLALAFSILAAFYGHLL